MGHLAGIEAGGFKKELDEIIVSHVDDPTQREMLIKRIDDYGLKAIEVLRAVVNLKKAMKTRPGLYPAFMALNEKVKKGSAPAAPAAVVTGVAVQTSTKESVMADATATAAPTTEKPP